VSKHISLVLHYPEETVDNNISIVLEPFPNGPIDNPITDYFENSDRLIKKIVDNRYSGDSEILGLLVLGVISSAEFYFRAVLSKLARTCPVCLSHAENVSIPFGSAAFYSNSTFGPVMSAFDHFSLADSKRIVDEIKRFSGFGCKNNTSLKKALGDFEELCEIRHCLVHSRGFVGLKSMCFFDGNRSHHKVLVNQNTALDLIKLSHNVVRAVNHHLSTEVLNRWIDRDFLSGEWSKDKELFVKYWSLFSKSGEDEYNGVAHTAYTKARKVILARRRGMAEK